MAEFDTSVNLKILDSLTITSELGPEDFEKAVFEAVSAGRTISDLGCGRIMADWSLFMRTRYVLCDIYEEGDAVQQEDGRQVKTYRIDVKAGEKNSFGGDIVYCFLFLAGFWFLRNYFTKSNALFLVLTALCAAFAVWLAMTPRKSGFGPKEVAEVVRDIRQKNIL